MDNGTEFTSVAMDRWAYWNGLTLDFSRPGKALPATTPMPLAQAARQTLATTCAG